MYNNYLICNNWIPLRFNVMRSCDNQWYFNIIYILLWYLLIFWVNFYFYGSFCFNFYILYILSFFLLIFIFIYPAFIFI